MLQFALVAVLLTGCAARIGSFGNPGDPLQQDMIANPSKYAPRPGTYRLPPDELPTRPLTMPTKLGSKEQAERLQLYQRIIADQMRDPDAVQFRSVSLHESAEGKDAICGEMNAKNAYGGYVGFERFYADASPATAERRASAVPYFTRNLGWDGIQKRCPQL